MAAALNHAKGLAIDANGNLYIADTDNSRIRKVNSTGMITTIAGNGVRGAGGDGGPAVNASLSDVTAVAVDGSGNIYIADSSNRRIRRVRPDGTITTIAGTGVEGFSGDGGPATNAMIGRPVALAFDGSGNLFFADSTNHRIRRIAATTGIITTVAGNGVNGFSGDGGQATSASLAFPIGLTFDPSGNIYIADGDNNRIRRITPNGIISTFAGNGSGRYAGDGGAALNASLNIPSDVAIDVAGNVYIADAGNNRIRKIETTGTITTIAGTGQDSFSGDGLSSMQAALNFPWAVTTDVSGGLYIADRVNNRVRYVASNISVPPPALSENSLVNAATFLRNVAIAPGSIVTIFGSNLSTGTASATTVPLPLSLGGASVQINGVAVPLFYASPGQINAQAPFDMSLGPARVQVIRGTSVSAATTSAVAVFSPGIFIINGTTGEGAVVHSSDGSLVSGSNPARAGESISIYTTGLGALRTPVASGAPAPTAPLAETMTTPMVLIGNQSATVTYSGLAPGFIGLYQVNAVVPTAGQSGYLPVQINVGGYGSNTATMAVSR